LRCKKNKIFFSPKKKHLCAKKIKMKARLPRTRALLEAHLVRDLAGCVMRFFTSPTGQCLDVARCGEHETCLQATDVNIALRGACEGGHVAVAHLMLAKGATYWHGGLYYACQAGHHTLVALLIAKGATDWDWGLMGACEGGHHSLVALMITKGATKWNEGLYWACKGGHHKLVALMIESGATDWNCALHAACRNGHVAIAKLMVAEGASHCSFCGSRDHWK
jgi:hypothetical protein